MYWVFLWPLVIDLQNLTLVKASMKDHCLSFLFMVLANNLGFDINSSNTDGTKLDIAESKISSLILALSELSWWPILKGSVAVIKNTLKAYITPALWPSEYLEKSKPTLSLALRVFGICWRSDASLLITLSHQALYWYPVAFMPTGLTVLSVFISCIQFMYHVAPMYLGNKINDGEE